jgi:hypothetical protein
MDGHWQESSWNNKPSLTIFTICRVTQVLMPGSRPEIPALLLKASLRKSLSKYVLNTQITVTSGGYQDARREGSILPGETHNVTIHCLVSKIPKPNEVLNVRLVVEDRLANKQWFFEMPKRSATSSIVTRRSSEGFSRLLRHFYADVRQDPLIGPHPN